MADSTPPQPRTEGAFRKVLSWIITLFSIIAIITIGIFAILNAGAEAKEKEEIIKYVFSSILPLIGTWMGAIIAFYFSKENFEAASNSMKYMFKNVTSSNEKLNSIKVTDSDVMRLFEDIFYNKDIAPKKDGEIFIKKDLIDEINKNNKGDRLPIFDNNKVIRYIVHLSTLNDFVVKYNEKKLDKLANKPFAEITLKDLLENSDSEIAKRLLSSTGFVSKDAKLLEAQAIIVNNQYCQDVFVTETGSKSEPVIGWITNNKITELARL